MSIVILYNIMSIANVMLEGVTLRGINMSTNSEKKRLKFFEFSLIFSKLIVSKYKL